MQEPYNRSSLAVDLQEDATLAWKPMPQLVPRPAPQEPQVARMFAGLDPSLFKKSRQAKVLSFAIHVLAISAILWWGITSHAIVQSQSTVVPIKFVLTDPPPLMTVAKAQGGGGGGGEHRVVAPVKAVEPKVVVPHVHLLPPEIATIEHPKLAEAPDQQVNMQVNTKMPIIGMSNSPQIALKSQGPGANSAFGMGMGGGIGMGQSSGNGPGSGGGYGGGVMSVGGGVSAPEVIHQVQAEFTEQARRANYQGTVSIQLIVDAQGNPQDARVVHHLGMGLDEKALEAVRQYKFRPAMYQGHPVAVQLLIDIDFRLH